MQTVVDVENDCLMDDDTVREERTESVVEEDADCEFDTDTVADCVLDTEVLRLSVCHVVGTAVPEAGPLDAETTVDVVAEGTSVEESDSLRAAENDSAIENEGVSLSSALIDALVECDEENEDLIVFDAVAVAACLLGDTVVDEETATPVELSRNDDELEAVRIGVPDTRADGLV